MGIDQFDIAAFCKSLGFGTEWADRYDECTGSALRDHHTEKFADHAHADLRGPPLLALDEEGFRALSGNHIHAAIGTIRCETH